MTRLSHRDTIVSSGRRTVHERGFGAAGVREITASAGVPQGSFTNHFASKDEFGLAVLDHYFQDIRKIISSTLLDESRPPLDRLNGYFDAVIGLFSEQGWRFGCLAGNMGLEASEHSEKIRDRLVTIFAEWSAPFAQAIRQAQMTGEAASSLDIEEAGAVLLDAWHGAMLRMKIERSPAPLIRFKRLILPSVLGSAS